MLNTLPVPSAQVALPARGELATLASKIRAAHAGVRTAFSDAIKYAIDCGHALIAAKELTPHGQWRKFLKRCDVGERQAERYMHLARLVAANPTCKSDLDLTGLTIERAIRKLSPLPRAHAVKSKKPTPAIKPDQPTKQTSHLDILASWMAASLEERRKAIDAIGLEPLLAALPAAWWSLLKKRFADRRHGSAPAVTTAPAAPVSVELRIPDDLGIPTFLKRSVEEPANQREDM
jgi:hypothetical protein